MLFLTSLFFLCKCSFVCQIMSYPEREKKKEKKVRFKCHHIGSSCGEEHLKWL